MAAARADEAKGDARSAYRAWHRYAALADDLAGLGDAAHPVDTAEPAARAAALGASEPVRAYVKERDAAAARDRQALRDAPRLLASAETDAVALQRTIGALRIPELLDKAARLGDTDEGLSAQRMLNTLGAQTAFYLPRQAIERKDYARAAFYLQIAAQIRPDDPSVRYSLAAAHARLGERRPALDELKRAVELGFPDARRLESDPAFESLRGETAFQEALAAVKRGGSPSPP